MQCVNHPDVDQDIVRCIRCARPFCPDCVVMLQGYWYCGACKTEQVRDIQSGTTTALELASIGRRIAAVLLDSLIQGVAAMLLVMPVFLLIGGMAVFAGNASQGGGSGAPEAAVGVAVMAAYLFMFFLSMALPLVYEGWMLQRGGQTLGKMAVSIRVVTVDGGPLTRGQSWGRAALKVALSQVCSCLGLLADDLPACFTAEKTALHDMAAGTRVVRIR